MKFLVTRMEALHDPTNQQYRQIKTSEMWPIVVEATTHEEAVYIAFDEHGFSRIGQLPKDFLVVAMIDAAVVKFRHKPKQYDVDVVPFNAGYSVRA